MSRSDYIFNVSVRLDERTLDKLDFIADVEGVARGRFVREALEDYLSGLSVESHPGLCCYAAYCEARNKERIMSRTAFIDDWKRKNKVRLMTQEGEKET